MPSVPPVLRRVAIIDDSPLVCALAEEVLTSSGYEVRAYTDPAVAVQQLEETAPSVVVCDLNMPGLSGVEVMAAVRASLPDVPVVIYTESNTVAAAVSALQQGAFRYVVKDAAATGLAPEVDRAYEQHLALRRARIAEEENLRYRRELELMVAERTEQLVREHTLRDRQRQLHEEQRKQAEARFAEVVERWPEPIAIVKGPKLINGNPALAKLLGYPAKEALSGVELLTLFHPEERESVRRSLEEATAAGGPMRPSPERRWLRKDGQTVVVEVSTLPVLWDGQQATMVMAKDVTELKKLTAKMMQVDRMVAVGTLAAGVGHEINNPLAYVLSNVLFAVRELKALESSSDVPLAARQRIGAAAAALDDARDGAERVRDIVRDLKTFSRAEDSVQEPVDIHAVLDSALAMARNEIRHRAQVVKRYGELPMVAANRSRLAQVFVNMLANAAHAIPDGHADRNHITLTTRQVGDKVEIWVGDTGSGIAPEHLPRIFDPFFTTKAVGEGTGLGLAICAGIIRDQGGDIAVETELGRGTTFKISLPVGAPLSRSEAAAPSNDAAARWSILVVDDEPMFGVALRRLLSGRHDVRVAGSGREALVHLESGQRFDAILSDVHMPEMTGIELYETIGERWPELLPRIGFVTGGAISDAARSFLDSRRDRIFEKPGSLVALEQFVLRLAAGGARQSH
jgi:PAS domain S-box-containing protein